MALNDRPRCKCNTWACVFGYSGIRVHDDVYVHDQVQGGKSRGFSTAAWLCAIGEEFDFQNKIVSSSL